MLLGPRKFVCWDKQGEKMGLPPLPPGAPEASGSLPQLKRFEQNLRSIEQNRFAQSPSKIFDLDGVSETSK